MNKTGKVILVGAGPGDPGLLTLEGKENICRAECIIYDRLASPQLLEHARPDCERIYVGKANHHHTMKQEDINDLLVQKAMEGKYVVRLKGGDPYVFGRGSEEAQYLNAHGIPVRIVSGVTSPVAVLAAAGIPVTHRGLAKGFRVITAHSRANAPAEIDYKSMLAEDETLIFLMGLSHVREIAENLIRVGRKPETPAAVVSSGTTAMQKTCRGNLGNIGDRTEQAGLDTPAILVVGNVVTLAGELNYFEKRVLFGKRVLVPYIQSMDADGKKGKEPDMAELLCREGAQAEKVPVGRIQALDVQRETFLQGLLGDWIVFTSRNGVHGFMNNLRRLGLDARSIGGRIAVVGKQTAEVLRGYYLEPDLISSVQTGKALARELTEKLSEKKEAAVTLYGAAQTDGEMERILAACCRVKRVAVYENEEVKSREEDGSVFQQMASVSEFDAVVFTSASCVNRLLGWLDEIQLETMKRSAAEGYLKLYSIGPKCTDAIRKWGFASCEEAEESSYMGIIKKIRIG